jgi:hypothetical protein
MKNIKSIFFIVLMSFSILAQAQEWRRTTDYLDVRSFLWPLRTGVLDSYNYYMNSTNVPHFRVFNNYQNSIPISFDPHNNYRPNIQNSDTVIYREGDDILQFDFKNGKSDFVINRDKFVKSIDTNYITNTIVFGEWNSEVQLHRLFYSDEYLIDLLFITGVDTSIIKLGANTYADKWTYSLKQTVIDGEVYIMFDEGMPFEVETPPRIAKWNGTSWEQVGLSIPEFENPRQLFKYNGELYFSGRPNPDQFNNHNNIFKLNNGLIWTPVGIPEISGTIDEVVEYKGDLFFLELRNVIIALSTYIWQYNPDNGFKMIAGMNGEFEDVFAIVGGYFLRNDEVYITGRFSLVTNENDTLLYNAKFPLEKWNTPNQAPVAMDDAFTWTTDDSIVHLNVLLNDNAIDGDYLKVELIEEPRGGDFSFLYDGTIMYLPYEDTWNDTIRYQACDMLGACDQATVILSRDRTDFGIEDDSEKKLNIYPNPASDYINISVAHTFWDRFELINNLGQTTKRVSNSKHNQSNINLSDIPNGIYQINVYSESKLLSSQKLQIQH